MDDGRARAARLAIGGALAWLALRIAPTPAGHDLVSRTLALAPLVVVPLALSLAPRAFPTRLLAFALPAGLAAAVSCALPSGALASGLAIVWLAFTAALLLVVRAHGALRLVAHVYLVVGAAWMLASRAGISPLGFGPVITALTATHFHYAGLGAPVLLAAASELATGATRRALVLACATLLGAMPVVALGLTYSQPLALAGAAAITLALFAGALALGRALWPRAKAPLARLTLIVVCASPLLSMPLALAWSWSRAFPHDPLPLGVDLMLRTHGMANAHGFVALGLALLAWHRHRAPRG